MDRKTLEIFMKMLPLIILVGLLPQGALAQSGDCKSIRDSSARLACYDRGGAPAQSSAAPSSVQPISRQAEPDNRPASGPNPAFAGIHGNIREFPGETQIRVISAAQAVLIRSDPEAFKIERSLDGFEATRNFKYRKVVGGVFGLDTWAFQTEANGGVLRASVNVTQATTVADNFGANTDETTQINTALATLFWSRVEYMLAQRADWMKCPDPNDKNAAALDALCGETNPGRNATPPKQFPPMQSASSATGRAARRGAIQ
jgi:hypothetical protein